MIKAAFDRIFFRGRAAREAILLLTKRIERLERELAKLGAARRADSSNSSTVAAEVEAASIAVRRDLGFALSEVIAALETEREFIRGLQNKMEEMELAHRDGAHGDIWIEIDEMRRALARLGGGAAGAPGGGKAR